jgi:hypothetical protein
VVGSWGQLNATYGDVLTVFDRTSSTPIFQVLDDIDEPGSIFSVDITHDGTLVSAGGKAVHAREFGNGGEVYAISTELGIADNRPAIPPQFMITETSPNPITTHLTIRFSVPRSGHVAIRAYDISGRIVAAIMDAHCEPGKHEVSWVPVKDNQDQLSSGTYFLRIEYEDEIVTRKVSLVAE